jgi:hypothetical protein
MLASENISGLDRIMSCALVLSDLYSVSFIHLEILISTIKGVGYRGRTQ